MRLPLRGRESLAACRGTCEPAEVSHARIPPEHGRAGSVLFFGEEHHPVHVCACELEPCSYFSKGVLGDDGEDILGFAFGDAELFTGGSRGDVGGDFHPS